MDKTILYSADGKTTITVFDHDVEHLKSQGWTDKKKSETITKTKTEE